MKTINLSQLNKNDYSALKELQKRVVDLFSDAEITLYGSKARGDFEEFSDIDVLVVLNCEVNNSLRERIYSISFDIELEYDVIFGIIVESKYFWNSSRAKSMPIHRNIDKEGILVTMSKNE